LLLTLQLLIRVHHLQSLIQIDLGRFLIRDPIAIAVVDKDLVVVHDQNGIVRLYLVLITILKYVRMLYDSVKRDFGQKSHIPVIKADIVVLEQSQPMVIVQGLPVMLRTWRIQPRNSGIQRLFDCEKVIEVSLQVVDRCRLSALI